jgi:hypothetical protein
MEKRVQRVEMLGAKQPAKKRTNNKERKRKVYESSEDSDFYRRDPRKRFESEERSRDEHRLLRYYGGFEAPMMPFTYGHPNSSYHGPANHYNRHQYHPGHNIRDYQGRCYNTDEDTSSFDSESSSSDWDSEEILREKIRLSHLRQINGVSHEPQVNPRIYDDKLPHEVGHHRFHLPPDLGRSQYKPHPQHRPSLPAPPPHHPYNPYAVLHFPYPHIPRPFNPAPLHYQYIYSMPFPAAHLFADNFGYYRDRQPPRHYPGHFFSPHHADVATPDFRPQPSKSKSLIRKDNKSTKRVDTIDEDTSFEERENKAQAIEDQKIVADRKKVEHMAADKKKEDDRKTIDVEKKKREEAEMEELIRKEGEKKESQKIEAEAIRDALKKEQDLKLEAKQREEVQKIEAMKRGEEVQKEIKTKEQNHQKEAAKKLEEDKKEELKKDVDEKKAEKKLSYHSSDDVEVIPDTTEKASQDQGKGKKSKKVTGDKKDQPSK